MVEYRHSDFEIYMIDLPWKIDASVDQQKLSRLEIEIYSDHLLAFDLTVSDTKADTYCMSCHLLLMIHIDLGVRF